MQQKSFLICLKSLKNIKQLVLEESKGIFNASRGFHTSSKNVLTRLGFKHVRFQTLSFESETLSIKLFRCHTVQWLTLQDKRFLRLEC